MQYYVISDAVNWADEFDMPFFEVLNEDAYELYSYMQKKLKTLYIPIYFGTNEGWDAGDVNWLRFRPRKISEEEYLIIDEYVPPGNLEIMEDIYDYLYEASIIAEIELPLKATLEDYKKIVDYIYNNPDKFDND